MLIFEWTTVLSPCYISYTQLMPTHANRQRVKEWETERERERERNAIHLPWPVHDWHTAITKGLSRKQAARGTVACPPSGPLWDAAATPQISCLLAYSCSRATGWESSHPASLVYSYALFLFSLTSSCLPLSLSSNNSLLPSSLPLLSLSLSLSLSPLYFCDFLPFLSLQG